MIDNGRIEIIKFKPEEASFYKAKVWLAKKLWRWAYSIHPYPPKFHQEISDKYVKDREEAVKFVKAVRDSMYASMGINHE